MNVRYAERNNDNSINGQGLQTEIIVSVGALLRNWTILRTRIALAIRGTIRSLYGHVSSVIIFCCAARIGNVGSRVQFECPPIAHDANSIAQTRAQSRACTRQQGRTNLPHGRSLRVRRVQFSDRIGHTCKKKERREGSVRIALRRTHRPTRRASRNYRRRHYRKDAIFRYARLAAAGEKGMGRVCPRLAHPRCPSSPAV